MDNTINNHTPYPWHIKGRCKDYCESEHCKYTWPGPESFYHGTGYAPEDAELVILAPTAPHICDDPECPGHINFKKLQLYDAMVAGLENAVQIYKGMEKLAADNKIGLPVLALMDIIEIESILEQVKLIHPKDNQI